MGLSDRQQAGSDAPNGIRYRTPTAIAVVDHEGAQAEVDAHHFETEARDAAQPLVPVLPQGCLASDHAVAVLK